MIFTTLFITCLAVDKLAAGRPGMILAGLAIIEIVINHFSKLEASYEKQKSSHE